MMYVGAKIQLSAGPAEGRPGAGGSFYHNANKPPDGEVGLPDWGLTAEENAFAAEPAWMLMKNRVVEKTVVFFAALGEGMRGMVGRAGAAEQGMPADGGSARGEAGAEGSLLGEVGRTPPKISRGENFKGLPWVVLDYPRQFGKLDIFAIRTLFWWGNYFSVTLHVRGRYKEACLPVLRAHIPELCAAGFHIGIADNEWRHEHQSDNYRTLEGMQAAQWDVIAGNQAFLKLSAKCVLDAAGGTANEPEAGDANGGAAAEILRLYEVLIRVLNGI